MGAICTLLEFKKKEKRDTGTRNPAQWLIDWVSGGSETSSGAKVNESNALKYTPFWSAVRIISGTVAMLPFKIYKRIPDGKEEANEHPIHKLLNDRPNNYIDSITFKEVLHNHVLTYGNGFAEIQRNGAGKPVALWPLLPDRTERKLDNNNVPYYIVKPQAGGEIPLPDYNVLHIKGLGFDGYTGYNVVTYHKEAIGYGIGVKEYGSRFFGNDASPGGVLEHPQTLGEKALEHVKEAWNAAHKGLSNAHRLQILEEGMKWHSIGIEPEKAQALEIQKYNVDDCSRIFCIPPHKLGSMDRATFCLPADVEVYTKDGNKSIANIKVGEQVWSLNKKNKWILSKVLKSDCTGKDEILNIRTTNRNIRANAKHKILIRRKYHAPKKGKGGYQYNEWRSEYIPAGELKIGDVMITSKKLPDIGLIQMGERFLNESFMEFCGLLLGDGNVNLRNGYISIARANNAAYMNHYREIIKKCFVSYDGGNGKNNNIGVLTKSVQLQEGERQTRFSSILTAKELDNLGFSGNARTKRVPEWVFQTNIENRLSFLRGFLDSDGSVDKKGRISFSSCNEKMLSQIRHLCIGCGIAVTNMRCQEGITTLPDGKLQAYKQYCFTCSNPADNKKIGSNDPRYIKRINEGKPFNKKSRKYPWYGGRDFDIDGCSLSRIVNIEKEPAEPVYDLTVEGTHSFIANGVVVHNSNIEEQNIDFLQTTMLYWFKKWELECNYKLFMPSEYGRLFSEILVAGLLRGNIKSRYEAYNIGRNGGWLSVNDIRRLENMNSIGEEGDIYLEPLNMKPAGTDTPAQEPFSQSRTALMEMIDFQWERVLRKLINTRKIDYIKQRESALNIMYSPIYAYASTRGIDQVQTKTILTDFIEERINESQRYTIEDAKYLTHQIIERIGGNHYAVTKT